MRISTVFLGLTAILFNSVVAIGADEISAEQFEERHSGAAVSDVNAKIEFGYYQADFGDGGNVLFPFDSIHAKFIEGAVSIPVGHSFGLQIDAGSLNGDLDAFSGSQTIA